MQRRTRQREAIEDALDATGRPLGPAEILELAKAEVPGLGIATVYRHLKALEADGRVTRVELTGQPRYERRTDHHHHHFHCRACDRVFELEGCPMGIEDGLAPDGFAVESHELVLYGTCAGCR